MTSEQEAAVRDAEDVLRCLDASLHERVEAAKNLVEAFGLPFEHYTEEEQNAE